MELDFRKSDLLYPFGWFLPAIGLLLDDRMFVFFSLTRVGIGVAAAWLVVNFSWLFIFMIVGHYALGLLALSKKRVGEISNFDCFVICGESFHVIEAIIFFILFLLI